MYSREGSHYFKTIKVFGLIKHTEADFADSVWKRGSERWTGIERQGGGYKEWGGRERRK